MDQIKEYFVILAFSLVLVLILLQLLRKVAIKINLVDKPNARKMHKKPIPIIGGVAIVIAAGFALLLSPEFWNSINEYYVLVVGTIVLLVIGAIDDKMDVRASLKLIIQIALAYFIFNSGVRIESMYGIFGIYELPYAIQYILTLLVIVGVINAFNLMDGIDGLAAGLSIIGFSAYTYIAILTGELFLAVLFVAIIGAIIGFLKFNLSATHKVFMGDAGSLVLGYILVVSGIMLLQSAQGSANVSCALGVVIGVLGLPVADSIRVYYKRIKSGNSPFKADKTHFHHLILMLGFEHKRASFIITFFVMCVIALSAIFGTMFNVTLAIISFLILYVSISKVLDINRNITIWREKIKKLEEK
ncbi:MAG: hypothetical protein COA50_12810 [Flavobacteriaceae bacterium]|nr:MAG: hypothetical protein COA50_12810 [Flavobacteriaceae bacterium]